MKYLNHLEEWIMAFLLGFMTLLTFVQVVLRYVFNSGWVWSLEATTYAFAWLVLIGMSYGVRTQSHIAVDIFTNLLPAKIKKVVALLAIAICVVYCGLMISGSYAFVEGLYKLGNYARDIHAPKWLLTAMMPLGFAILTLRFIEAGWHIIKGDIEEIKEEQTIMMDGSDQDGSNPS
jgi:C4-dicarboxylate transporter DctQ subunit